ncbi:MAG: 1-acyl-sn-glycerol-3-phosphate acyltransferase [Chloroflexi bacterium]|nr:MAG: 1-acyl-sn-glycerol-3-phosphate acyltransferase [Chloroflexota bacterium]MBL1194130.1 1-acyl-sn-glycerol-3-phosphate acyltransferase [Chloroflexota bacterium]NOH11423.1 1-acyl-sn-glycerol-3-phosphate acyltransferase [Chloroflexota bacterium]
MTDYSLKSPRRRILRAGMRGFGRGLFNTLSRTQVNNKENFPKGGPLIVVGNHIAVIEVALMVVYSPWQIEMMGAGDLPFEPGLGWVVHTYGFIPVRRGSTDRASMEKGLEVLAQGGIVGIFPEGGIWSTQLKKAQSGVAWLSYRAQAPILPIGFGGVAGALKGMFELKRPEMVMNVGKPIPPIQDREGISKKQMFADGAETVMRAIEELIPPEDVMRGPKINDERFELQLQALNGTNSSVSIPPELHMENGPALARMFHQPVILNVFRKNLRLPVETLRAVNQHHAADTLCQDIDTVLGYLNNDNPYFLTYRFGNQVGWAMKDGLEELRKVTQWAKNEDYLLSITPVRRYYLEGQSEEIVEDDPGSAHSI